MSALLAALLLSAAVPRFAPVDDVVHLVTWEGGVFDDTHPRTGQPPLTNADLVQLSRGGLPPRDVVHLLEERRCACDVSPAALVQWRRAGVDPTVIAAASLHALPPNRRIELALDIALPLGGRTGNPPLDRLVVFIDDALQSRSLEVPLRALVDGTLPGVDVDDATDALLTKRTRHVHLRGSLPLTSPGRRSVLVALTRGPLVKHPAELTKAELTKARVHTLAYPASSSRAACTLRVRLEPDALLSESVALTSSALACDFGD